MQTEQLTKVIEDYLRPHVGLFRALQSRDFVLVVKWGDFVSTHNVAHELIERAFEEGQISLDLLKGLCDESVKGLAKVISEQKNGVGARC